MTDMLSNIHSRIELPYTERMNIFNVFCINFAWGMASVLAKGPLRCLCCVHSTQQDYGQPYAKSDKGYDKSSYDKSGYDKYEKPAYGKQDR
eukprot:4395987-Amphidinium_carterae.1